MISGEIPVNSHHEIPPGQSWVKSIEIPHTGGEVISFGTLRFPVEEAIRTLLPTATFQMLAKVPKNHELSDWWKFCVPCSQSGVSYV
jgi:hypothetical protein